MQKWTLHDSTGPVRRGIEEYELFGILRQNALENIPVFVQADIDEENPQTFFMQMTSFPEAPLL